MKIFISSLITDMHEERSAVREAIEQLDHEPIMAEQFGGQPNSSQVACLNGVRDSATARQRDSATARQSFWYWGKNTA